MLINIKTDNGNAILNSDNIDIMFFSSPDGKLYVYRSNINDCITFSMSKAKMREALEEINEKIDKQKISINTE